MSQPLTAEQRKLFDECRAVARRAARTFVKRNGKRRHFEEAEVDQFSLEALWKAASNFDPASPAYGGHFEPYAFQRILWALKDRFFGSHEEERADHEVSGSTPVVVDDEESDLMNEATIRAARAELTSDPGEERLGSTRVELRKAIVSAAGLDSRERRALILHFVFNLELHAIASRLAISRGRTKGVLKAAIKKLRAYFQSRGLVTLPITAPVPRHLGVASRRKGRKFA